MYVYMCLQVHTNALYIKLHVCMYTHAVLVLCLWRVMKGKLEYVHVSISVWGAIVGISSALLLTDVQ